MNWRSTVALAVALVAAAALAAFPARAEATARPLVVTLARGAAPGAAGDLFQAAGVHAVDRIAPLDVYRVEVDAGGDAAAARQALAASPLVQAVEDDGEQRIQVVPDDPRYRELQWNLQRIGMEHVWDLRPTARDMIVAVLDTGVDLTHPDLQGNLLASQGYDFVNDVPLAQDDDSHGTGVAGIVGAIGNNHQGVAGIAWAVKILPIKVLNAEGRGSNSTLARAIVYAVDQGARILNISSTSSDYSAALERAVGYARDQGVLVVAAAGNTGDQGNETTYPAAFDGVLAVGAVDAHDQVAPFSQHAPWVGVLAPGVDVPSTAWIGAGRGAYASYSGTSIAAPHAAGLAALLWTLRPDLLASDLVSVLETTADPAGQPGGAAGASPGILDGAKALATVRPGVTPTARTDDNQAQPVAEPLPLPAEPRRWYFAEGSTNTPFDLSFAVFNPGQRASAVHFAFLTSTGRQVPFDISVAAGGRATVHANDVVPSAEVSTIVQSDGPVYVERSMYFGHDGHTAPGARDPSRTWYLAEGSTVPPFDTWVLLLNPNQVATTATLRFLKEDGNVVEQQQLIPPMSRRSVYVNQLFTTSGFATQVSADQPVVVERAMYFDGGAGGDDTLATRAPATTWYVADGTSRNGFDTWLLVSNPGNQPANARATFFSDTGRTVTQPLLVAPHSRASLYTNLVVPDSVYSTRVDSDQPLVAEEAVYFADHKAGYDAMAVGAPATEWFLPEGSATGSFVEQIAILNPQSQAANVQLDFHREDSQARAPVRLRAQPNARTTVDVNPYVLDGNAAIRVIADRPIVVERTEYFARPTGIGATSAPGQTR